MTNSNDNIWAPPQGPPLAPYQPPGVAPPDAAPTVLLDEPGPGKNRGWLVILIVGAALVLLAGAVVANWGVHNYSLSQLLTKIQTSEDAMGRTQDEVVDLIDESRSKLSVLEQTSAEALSRQLAKDGNGDKIEAVSAQGAREVEAAGAAVAGSTYPFWLGDVLDAQSVYMEHNKIILP